MARYATTVRSERPAPVAFAFVADLSNLPQWDPGVQKVSQLRGDGLSAEAAYEVVLSSAGNTRLVYEVTEFDHEALTATLVATHSWFRSIDTISATGDDDGSDVTYDATLELRGPLALLDPLLGLIFNRIGDKAAAGLIRVLETPIAPSFTRIGAIVRSRTEHWTDLDDFDLTGRTILLTGATSGLGLAAAHRLAGLGATLLVVGRNPAKTDAACAALPSPTGATHTPLYADLGDLAAVAALADTVIGSHDDLDTLIHNAGALSAERTENADGIESTVASQVLGPFLLTARLLPTLRSNGPARVLTMSSGGMYSAGLTVNRLQMSGPGSADPYRGAEQYARAKRAQVTLTEIWAEKFADSGVRFHSLHPGWADTPGVEEALPTFRKIVGPLLRSPAEGADTLVWLTADDTVVVENGLFWHDRAPRAIHRLPQTRRSDTPERRADLWDWCVAQTGVDPEA